MAVAGVKEQVEYLDQTVDITAELRVEYETEMHFGKTYAKIEVSTSDYIHQNLLDTKPLLCRDRTLQNTCVVWETLNVITEQNVLKCTKTV